MNESEQQAAEIDEILERERGRHRDLKAQAEREGGYFDPVIGKWMEVLK